MAVQIKFDNLHNPIRPTVVLATKGGEKLGVIPNREFIFKDAFAEASELTFKVDSAVCNKQGMARWDSISDFKLAWTKDWNRLYEIHVKKDEKDGIVKTVTAIALGEAELSQINLYGVEINTDEDIARDDYIPSKLYDANNPRASIITRLLEKAPHYTIRHVDSSISAIQRSFSFNEKSIYDAFQEISEEIECVFIYDCYFDENGGIHRDINVYDLKSYCLSCGERGDFEDTCINCGESLIRSGYGEDTTIFVSRQNLADSITYGLDHKSVKNCFKLEAGDDLMTATIQSCNPNGSGYIWYIPQETRNDMSTALAQKLNDYDAQYDYFQNEYKAYVPQNLLTEYNRIVNKYKVYSNKYSNLASPIIGYPALMQAYYDTIDFNMYLTYELMPSSSMQNTTAQIEAAKLLGVSSVAVKNLNTVSKTTADASVLAYAKYIIDPRYKVAINESSYSGFVWRGKMTVTNYSDDTDAYTSGTISYNITSDYELYIKQMLEKALKKEDDSENPVGIAQLFELSASRFQQELKKYSLSRLKSFYDACNGCISIMTEQGVSNTKSLPDSDKHVYDDIFLPYYNKLSYIESEISIRENEISVITGKKDGNGSVTANGVQTEIDNARSAIGSALDLENYLGTTLWKELASYRREDTYKNSNYISDGLSNAEIFANALQFIDVARKEIFKSATMQHSIKANIKNLLVIKEFEKISDHFEVGNWIRVSIDGNIYKLRILNYEINFDDVQNIQIEFSDVLKTEDGYSDLKSILENASSMATSYDYVARQAKKGSDGRGILEDWVSFGLEMTQTKIINDADNQNFEIDRYGLSCKSYIPELDSYDDKQLKIINRGIYLTDDNWKTSRAGIGDFIFYNPKTRNYEESYGVIADTLVGNLILSREVGIYNESGSIEMSKDGFIITSDQTDGQGDTPIFLIQKNVGGNNYPIMSLDQNGLFRLNASQVLISSSNDIGDRTFDMLEDGIKAYADSKIQTNSNEILLSVEERYSTKDELGVIESAMSSRIDQTSQEIGFYFEAAESRIEDVDGELRSQIDEIKTNFRFTSSGQYIGVEGSDAIMHLYNDVMEILVSGNPVTTVNRSGLIAAEASITTLHIGDYLWTYDEVTGHMTLT